MSRLAKVESFFKNVNLTSDDEVFVGVDVHKKSYHVALYLNDMPAIDFQMGAEPRQLDKKLQPMACSIKDVVYETGSTGYGLARHLRKNKLPANVVATSKIPRPVGADDKTDRLDSMKLAQYAAKGLLRPVTIPTPKQEADRQLYRMRHRQTLQFAKVKTQIKSFLLMHGIGEPDGLANWTKASVGDLRDMQLLDTLLGNFRLSNNSSGTVITTGFIMEIDSAINHLGDNRFNLALWLTVTFFVSYPA